MNSTLTVLNRIIKTEDGSHTLYVPALDEHYHSIHGAIQESEHVFIKNGFDISGSDPLHIFEAGFGTGLNALLTAISNLNSKRVVFYTAFEKYPVDPIIIKSLNYNSYFGEDGLKIFRLIHSSEWGKMNRIWENFSIRKVNGDLIRDSIQGRYGLIYYDAFGPDKQPEMWTTEVFRKIAEVTVKDGIFVTYSSKGVVKRMLRDCGFKVNLLPGPPGKRHIIRAVKS